ncbi:F-box/RNI-like superfamily protein [Theobroma cacao]|uniref:F-box/RNI-like superfamily protein n=1 Tax=Theobroma cacao TaxID=3641 RepID=A0A061FZ54_THECC|nr:F-box/RNI-like superfamily protein [Theobroma cacao]
MRCMVSKGQMEDFSDMLLFTLGRRNMTIEDRISKLPDGLLLKIMSFLNTKQAVQTCVLSKRWKPLWQSLPNLVFDFDTFPFQQEIDDEDQEEVEMKMCSFSNFIRQVLFRRCPTDLVKVCVQSHIYDPHCFLVDGLLCYAVKHNVQQLTFHSRSDCQYLFPESFWTCQSLTSLELKGSDWMPMKLPTLLACPALKSLHLSHFSTAGPNFEPTAFSGCLNLETLQLFDILAVGSEGLCIDALKLTSLVLSFAFLGDGKVEIYAPRLTTFKYSGTPPIVCLTDHLASVDNVYFDIKTPPRFRHSEGEYVLRSINTLSEFRHAKSLTLSSSTVQVLTKFPSLLDQNPLSFANLKHMKIKVKKWERDRFEMPACILNYFFNNSAILRIWMDSFEDSQ